MKQLSLRILSILLSLAILAIGAPLSVSAAYENTHVNTVDVRVMLASLF